MITALLSCLLGFILGRLYTLYRMRYQLAKAIYHMENGLKGLEAGRALLDQHSKRLEAFDTEEDCQ